VTEAAFLDTNVILRHVLADHFDQSPRATALVRQIERGDLTVRISDTVVFEAVFTLEKVYRVPRPAIRDALQPILALPGVLLPGKTAYRRVFELYVERAGLSFADCYHAVLVQRREPAEIISFDQKIGRVPGITRREPA
jgi:predicted nucleic acid-binding protein